MFVGLNSPGTRENVRAWLGRRFIAFERNCREWRARREDWYYDFPEEVYSSEATILEVIQQNSFLWSQSPEGDKFWNETIKPDFKKVKLSEVLGE